MAEAQTTQIASHTFAWDGFSFEAPEDWHLSLYHFGSTQATVEMQDDEALRLQMEWLRPAARMTPESLHKRYTRATSEWKDAAADAAALPNLPPGWTAYVYTMPDRKRLAAAWWLAPDRRFIVLLRLHFDGVGHRRPAKVVRHITQTFALHNESRIPWRFYDVSFELGRQFKLVATELQAGRKLMVFQWRLRKLYIWQVSLADMALKGRSPNAWAAEFLNAYKPIKGVVFSVPEGDAIEATRGGTYRWGHYDEIGRLCFRYRAVCRHYPESNTLRLMLFNYRRRADLQALEDAFDFARPRHAA